MTTNKGYDVRSGVAHAITSQQITFTSKKACEKQLAKVEAFTGDRFRTNAMCIEIR